MTVQDTRPAPISTQDQAKSIVRALANKSETYREFGDIPQVRTRLAFQIGLTEEEMDNLYNRYLTAQKTLDDIEWTGRPAWDDQWEIYHQNAVHDLTRELSTAVGGPVVADTLAELIR